MFVFMHPPLHDHSPPLFIFVFLFLNLLLLARLFQQYHRNEILDKQKQTDVAKLFIHF